MESAEGRSINKAGLKKRLLPAILGGIVPSSMFFFFGIIEIYFGNREEFLFSFFDFGIITTVIALAVAAAIAMLILFLPDTASRAVFGVSVWISVMGFIQSVFLNGSGSLDADSGAKADTSLLVVDTLIWIAVGVIAVGAALLMKKKTILKPVLIIALISVIVMMMTSCATNIFSGSADTSTSPAEDIESDSGEDIPGSDTSHSNTETKSESEPVFETIETVKETETELQPLERPEFDGDASDAYLTKSGLDQVSSKNIVIFVIDRFDVKYYKEVVAEYPDFFDDLDGFTYFSDNISLYSRTYPAVPTMITGIDLDFTGSANDYFMDAYQNSPFLNDLKNNGYAIKLYTQNFYCYREGTPLVGVADNLSVYTGYTITDRSALVGNMVKLSAYRYFPTIFKDSVDISSDSFNGIVKLNGDYTLYELNDPAVCGQIINDGLSLDENNKSYTFIHLSGCHSPYNMDENANWSDNSSASQQLRGCMKMIYKYIDEMKRLGVYDDSTIVITGDHPAAVTDYDTPWQPRLTALFVKPAGAVGSLKYSTAEVCQDNLIPTLVQSAGIKTSNEYGLSYFDIQEGTHTVRHHKFELCIDGNAEVQIVDLEVNGDGTDFSNWHVKSYTDIGALYK